MRFYVALWAGKLAILTSRLLGKGASHFPGSVAKTVDPDVLRRLASQVRREAIIVTGTNGKTTTARMISDILTGAGFTVVHNRSGATLVLNADDPLVASLGEASPVRVVYYGLADDRLGTDTMEQAREAKYCLRCGQPYDYDFFFYAHLGRYRCPNCGQVRPDPLYRAEDVHLAGARGVQLRLVGPKLDTKVSVTLPGLYNTYNVLAAATAASVLGLRPADVKRGLESSHAHFGRMETVVIDGRDVLIALVKNPVGFNEVVRTVLDGQGPKSLVIAINDNYADGTDISWLWDVDLEVLGERQDEFDAIITSGIRAADMAVRLKYAGIKSERILVVNDVWEAVQQGLAGVQPGGMLYVLPTYTAMLDVRDQIARHGYTRQFWEV